MHRNHTAQLKSYLEPESTTNEKQCRVRIHWLYSFGILWDQGLFSIPSANTSKSQHGHILSRSCSVTLHTQKMLLDPTDHLVYSFVLNQNNFCFIPDSCLYNLFLKFPDEEGSCQVNYSWDLLLEDFNDYWTWDQLAETFEPPLRPKISKYFYLQLRIL